VDSKINSEIEKRAYELFLERGGQHGYALEDWVKAKDEVTKKHSKPAAKAPAAAEKVVAAKPKAPAKKKAAK
jgi:hypothetical protein